MTSGLGELFVELGTIGDVKELEKFVKKVKEGAEAIERQMKAQDKNNANLKKFMRRLAGVATAISGTIYAINRLTNDLVRNNQAFINLTRQSDIALSSFQKWNSIGKMFGVENAAGQLENLNERLFELRLTGEGARGFQLAGINPIGQDAEGVLEQIRNRIQGMDNTSASYLLKQMGLDPRMITLLRMSREEFDELGKTMRKYQLTDSQRQQIEKMNVQLQIAAQKLQYLKDRAILKLMPVWIKFVQSFARVTEGLARFVNWTTKAAKYIMSLKIGVVSLSQAITGILIPSLIALGLIFKPLETLFVGLYLVIDDFMGYMEGKDSVLGLLLNFIDELNDKINFGTPKWVQDLLAILQNINSLKGLQDVTTNIANGKQNSVDLKQVSKSVMENPLTWLAVPGLAPFGWSSKVYSGLIPKINQGIQNQNSNQQNLDSLSWLITPPMNQSIENSNDIYNNYNNDKNVTVAMTNYFDTEQPAQDINRELRYTINQFA